MSDAANAPAAAAPPAPVPEPAATPTKGTPGRKPRLSAAERIEMAAAAMQEQEYTLPKGKGKKLLDVTNVASALSNPVMPLLLSVCCPGAKVRGAERKALVGDFRGFAWVGTDEEEKKAEELTKLMTGWKLATRVDFATALGIKFSQTNKHLQAQVLVEFLKKPTETKPSDADLARKQAAAKKPSSVKKPAAPKAQKRKAEDAGEPKKAAKTKAGAAPPSAAPQPAAQNGDAEAEEAPVPAEGPADVVMVDEAPAEDKAEQEGQAPAKDEAAEKQAEAPVSAEGPADAVMANDAPAEAAEPEADKQVEAPPTKEAPVEAETAVEAAEESTGDAPAAAVEEAAPAVEEEPKEAAPAVEEEPKEAAPAAPVHVDAAAALRGADPLLNVGVEEAG